MARLTLHASILRIAACLIVPASVCGCIETDIPPAGSYSEVLLVTEGGSNDPLARAMVPYLARPLDYYVSSDVQFKVSHARAARLEVVPQVKNIVFCGVVSPVSSVGRRIAEMLGPEVVHKVEEGKANFFKKNDLPGPGQLTVIVTAMSSEELIGVLEERGDEINEAIEQSCRERLRRVLLKNRRSDLTRRFQREYGFEIQIPELYRLLSDEGTPPGVELLRDGPPRSLGIFWLDRESAPTLEDGSELFDARARYVYARYDGDVMDSTRVRFEAARLGRYPAIKMEGYWSNSRAVAGGYFRTYFVHEESEELTWAVDLLVFAPGLEKHPLFRELLAIAETFRYD